MKVRLSAARTDFTSQPKSFAAASIADALLFPSLIVERTLDNSAAYIQSWLARLKEDSRLIVQAAAAAQKAADFILGKVFTETEAVE
jgi:antirestriction protein ArdC